ncbi:deoxyribose-phosphate aldolase [Kocuria marina]|uniref:deoxyribose-phosphate aldolase n=1 Tax=Kocuria marina TaxID=223184 RepID=UPI002FD7A805
MRTRAEVAALIDHTLLKPEATAADVETLIAEATELGTWSVCVSPNQLPLTAPARLRVATVCGFPSGAHHAGVKAAEAARSLADAADEIDMVIDLALAHTGDFGALEAEIRAVREAVPAPAVLKVILETAALTDDQIISCCRAAEAAGADFVKTSTGFHPAGGASVHAVELMAATVGGRLGIKASGGIRTAEAALAMLDAGATRLGLSASRAVLDGLEGLGTETRSLLDHARTWIAQDPDPATRDELTALVEATERDDADAHADLASRFAGPLTFGTAGLRGAVAAGQSRMNTAVVTRATAGLAHYLTDTVGAHPRVVVGCDARHGSAAFREATLGVLSAAGATALALPPRLPTPVTAFAVRELDADAGVMVTASHNPAADNGYKVYLGGRAATGPARGVQIVPPADAQIAARIAAAPGAAQIPVDGARVEPVGGDLLERYIDRAASLRGSNGPTSTRVVLTPMHGVGGTTAREVLRRAGVGDVHVVTAQAEPDPGFPTIPFPNPEEPGALDLALDLAREVGADVVVALDPDADRCSVAIPQRDGTWRQLTGDEIGAVLGEQAARDSAREGDVLACSIVSSRLLGRIAAAHGLRHATTLTGFKWIARTPGLRFGYEEAIGYCTDPAAVRDKDGITAMVRIVALIEDLAREHRTLEDLLDDLAREHGLHATAPLSFRVPDRTLITEALDRLRATEVTELAGSPVVEARDLAEGSEELPPTDGLLFYTEAGDRVIARPSGTEPKLKCYLEVVLACDGGDVPRKRAAARLEQLSTDMRALLGL